MSRYDPANKIFMEHVACQALDDLQENEKKQVTNGSRAED
jgi:hypothetical protein